MDEKPNNIDNEKPLNNNGFSSVSNHQDKIDNLDDSSKNNLQNDQNNQLNKQNILRNTNPMANKQDENINSNINNQNNLQQSMRSNENVPDALKRDNELPPKLSNGVSELDENHDINKPVGIKGRLLNGIKPGLLKGGKVGKALAAVKTIRSVRRIALLPALLPILPIVLIILIPVIIIAVVVVSMSTPLTMKAVDVTGSNDKVVQDYFTFKGTVKNKGDMQKYYEKIDLIENTYSDIDRTLEVAGMHYGFYQIGDYFDELDNTEKEIKFDYNELTKYALTFSNQLVYSTVVFDNNIIQREKEEEVIVETTDENGKTKKVKKKVKKKIYECPTSSYTISTPKKELCSKDGVALYTDGPGELDYSTADMCIDITSDSKIANYLSDPNFNKNMKCVSINYDTNTENSKKKYENFLRYILLPDKYFDEHSFVSLGYDWDKMVSKFSSIKVDSDEDDYNIPAYKVGVGKDIDYYSDLDVDEKRKIDDAIRTIMNFASFSKANKVSQKYYIKGAASLPLDFTIKETAEETIKSRISGEKGLFGWRIHPIYNERRFHYGVDLSKNTNSDPVYSVLDGVVISNLSGGCGIGLLIGHDVDEDGNYDYYTKYCHLAKKLVNAGDTVLNGQQIGVMGNTGDSTGIHLHFEWHDSNNSPQDPVPVLISIVENSSLFNSQDSIITSERKQELEEIYNNLISGNLKTRKGVVLTAKFLIDNLSTLPYFCGGYTPNLISESWYNDELVTDTSCSNYNTNSKYGLDSVGFVNWVLTQAGYSNQKYTYDELLNLGEKVDMSSDKVQIGDIAYNNNKIGVITELDEQNAVVISMELNGLKATTINRKLVASLFPKVVSMNKFYMR